MLVLPEASFTTSNLASEVLEVWAQGQASRRQLLLVLPAPPSGEPPLADRVFFLRIRSGAYVPVGAALLKVCVLGAWRCCTCLGAVANWNHMWIHPGLDAKFLQRSTPGQ